jgi:histidinol-phosphatase
MSELETDLAPAFDLAIELVDRCDSLTLPLFRRGAYDVEYKPNRTEVTEVDRAAETMITEMILARYPHHRVTGEEYGSTGDPAAEWEWIIDPIDGTSGFVRGQPVWATLIALEHRTTGLAVAMVSAPALHRRWWATAGGGAQTSFMSADHDALDDLGDHEPSSSTGNQIVRQCQVSATATLADAQVSVTPNEGWEQLDLLPALMDLQIEARRSRGFGDFWQHCLVAEGALDLAVDAVGLAPYDLAAIRLVVEEAGGRFTDRQGVATHRHDTAISSNGHLHDLVISRLATHP